MVVIECRDHCISSTLSLHSLSVFDKVSVIPHSQFNGSPLRSHVTSDWGSAAVLHLIDIVSPSVQFILAGLSPSRNDGGSANRCRHFTEIIYILTMRLSRVSADTAS